jgi:signal peptidase I
MTAESDSARVPQEAADATVIVPPFPRRKKSRTAIVEFLESLLAAILMALFLIIFVVQSFEIPSESMAPTLLTGDYLLVNKFIFGGHGAWYERALPYRDVRRGEVIVFKYPYDDHPYYVKRVIGLPGDHIRIANQAIYVNGFTAPEPHVVHDAAYRDPFGDNFPPAFKFVSQRGLRPEWAAVLMEHVVNGELVVPQGNYFVMGDNRDHSWDSRYWGFVDRGAIIGRPVGIYWSHDSASDGCAVSGGRRGATEFFRAVLHVPRCTRWPRLGHEVH